MSQAVYFLGCVVLSIPTSEYVWRPASYRLKHDPPRFILAQQVSIRYHLRAFDDGRLVGRMEVFTALLQIKKKIKLL